MIGNNTTVVHGYDIIFWADNELRHESLVLCQNVVRNLITTILRKEDLVNKLLLGAGKIILCIIIVWGVP